MIITITPNPAVDRTLTVAAVQAGAIHRATHSIVAAGGKGLNVARAIHQLGAPVVAMGLVGGYSGQWVAVLAADEGIAGNWTWTEQETRTCTMVVAEGADATVFNESGPTLNANDWHRLIEDVVRQAREATVVALCGSLPHGIPANAPADFIKTIQAAGVPVWVDTSGVALEMAMRATPYGVKVNGREAEALLGTPITTPSDAIKAAHLLREHGIAQVIITLGAAGAVLVNEAGTFHAVPPPLPIVSTVGSGDAFFGGWLTALLQGKPVDEALRLAVAAGSANALAVGGGSVAKLEEVLALGVTVRSVP